MTSMQIKVSLDDDELKIVRLYSGLFDAGTRLGNIAAATPSIVVAILNEEAIKAVPFRPLELNMMTATAVTRAMAP